MPRLQGRCPICKKYESAGDIIRGFHVCPPSFLVCIADDAPEALSDFTRIYADSAEGASIRYVQQRDADEPMNDTDRTVFVYEERTGGKTVFTVSAEIVVQYSAIEARYEAPSFPRLADLDDEPEPDEEPETED